MVVLTAVLRHLPAPLLKALDEWSSRVARRKALRRKAAVMRRRAV